MKTAEEWRKEWPLPKSLMPDDEKLAENFIKRIQADVLEYKLDLIKRIENDYLNPEPRKPRVLPEDLMDRIYDDLPIDLIKHMDFSQFRFIYDRVCDAVTATPPMEAPRG